MKISNYRLTQYVAFLLIASILSSILMILISKQLIIDIACAVLIVSLLLLLLRLQCIVYENSGNCVTFRKYHPFTFKKFIPPFIELPQSSIKDFNFRKGVGISRLTLRIDSRRRKKTVVKIFLLGFSNSQNNKISSSLQSIRLKNNNQMFN